jgi:hypothetical protein
MNATTGWRAMMRISAAINPSGVTEPGEPELVLPIWWMTTGRQLEVRHTLGRCST